MSLTNDRIRRLAIMAVLPVLFLAACGGDDSDTTDTTGTDAAAGPTSEEMSEWQTQLQAVGCYHGDIDGIDGPETDEAILAFQQAEGLTADDIMGPDTEQALQEAYDDGREVCAQDLETTTTTAAAEELSGACTEDAISSAITASEEYSEVGSIGQFECSGDWAYAEANVGGTDTTTTTGDATTTTAPEVTVTILLEAHDGGWQVVDRGGPCGDGEVPEDIRQAACETN